MISIYLGLDLDLKFVSESWLMSMLWNGWDNSHLIKIWYFSKYSNISLTLSHSGNTQHGKLDPRPLTSPHLSFALIFIFHIHYQGWRQLNCDGGRHKPGTVHHCVSVLSDEKEPASQSQCRCDWHPTPVITLATTGWSFCGLGTSPSDYYNKHQLRERERRDLTGVLV